MNNLTDITTNAKASVKTVVKEQLIDKEAELTDKAADAISNAVEAVVEKEARSLMKRLFLWLAKKLA